ncbi:MAG: methyltransferase domain-containing protein [Clostridioides sp.]|jgi:ubiquinone/menaquinone biosynthesis C-methylase UbiE|nr:methyltransferase domain-containing protein [Clostridioides sp.]
MKKRAKFLTNVTDVNKIYMRNVIKDGDIVVDATMGNGNDTKFLAELVGQNGFIYAFDVQPQALEETSRLLEKSGFTENVSLILDGHENILKHVDREVDFVIFNLGYLPRADHNVKTRPETTIKAVEGALSLLKQNGIMSIAMYTGHDGGKEERDMVYSYLEKLPQDEFSVMENIFVNQVNNPPQLLIVEKI